MNSEPAGMLMSNLRLIEIELNRQLNNNALVKLNPLLAGHLRRVLHELRAAMDYLTLALEESGGE